MAAKRIDHAEASSRFIEARDNAEFHDRRLWDFDPLPCAALAREMACTRAELLAWLRGVAGDAAVHVDGNEISVVIGHGLVTVVADERPDRRVGALVLPVLRVAFRFREVDATARERLMARFDLHTRRGGG